MTSYSANNDRLDFPALFSPHFKGQSQAWDATHMGLGYHGEVIVASRWDDEWGKALTDNRYFRIVLLTSRQRSPTWTLRDARIAVCTPAQDVLNQRQTLDRELRSIAEARGLYTTRRQVDSTALRSSLEQREGELTGEFLQSCSLSYASGQIRNTASMDLDAGHIFRSSDPSRWFQELAETILARTYPTLPIQQGSFTRPLSGEDLAAIFDGIAAEASQPWSQEAIRRFAVGLGLAPKGNPSTFDPRDCTVFGLIRQELAHQRHRVPMPGLTQLLGHSYGLPFPLVGLFLLAFVKYAQPEVELDLASEHPLLTREGTSFPGDRLTRDMVGQIRWHHDLWASLTSLHLPDSPTWNTALPFIQIIAPEAERATPSEVSQKQAALLSKLKELSQAAGQALVDIRLLLDEQAVSGIEDRLKALVTLGRSADYEQFYDTVRDVFQGVKPLEDGRHLPAQVSQLKAVFPEIAAVRSYLWDMSFGPNEGALALDLQALVYETDPAHILENPALWPAIKERFARLRQRYTVLYRRHHAQYRKDAAALWARMQQALPLVEALEQLNSITELGAPIGEGLPYQFEQLNVGLKMCRAAEAEVLPEQGVVCPYCGLQMPESVPYQEIEAFLVDVEQAVREQNRRLSLYGIQQILEQGEEEMVDKLIKIVRMADVGPLANVLSPQVLAFLRTFLAER
jgi:hypothetical protein